MIPYKHEPFTDFTKEENKQAYQEALKLLKATWQDYPLIIGAENITTEEKLFHKPCK